MASKKFEKIREIEELKRYLENRGSRHQNYYHYTNIQSLKKILETRELHLSWAKRMNDLQELTKGAQQIWDRTYIASFGFGSAESIAMWGLYGIPRKDAVRIGIPRKTMIKILERAEQISLIESIKMTDIVYAQGNKDSAIGVLKHQDGYVPIKKAPNLISASTIGGMTGFIKNIAWQYENEVRIKCTLRTYTGQDKIIIPLPQNFADEISITTGPWDFESEEPIFFKLAGDSNLLSTELEQSIFLKMIKMRDQCDFCQKRPFEKCKDYLLLKNKEN